MTHRLRAQSSWTPAACAFVAASLVIGLTTVGTPPANGKEISSRRLTPVVRAVRTARPAVVNIQGQKVVTAGAPTATAGDASLPRQVNGMGTGVVIDERGYILTNYHVVADVRRIEVTLDNRSKYTAELIARDPVTDLAVIKIPTTEPLAVIRIGTSADLMAGEPVIALGNAFGYEHTVTRGIISALGRNVEVSDTQTYEDLIQTDASINPGNSGGPLLNIEGDMIGLNVAVRAGAQGIGFAIPIDKVMIVATGLLSVEQLQNKWHGIVSLATDDPDEPLVVEQVRPGSPADKAGLRPGDRIRVVNERAMQRPLDVERALIDRKVGEHVPVGVVRSGERLTLDLALASRSKSWEILGLDLVPEPKETFQKRTSRYRGGMRVVDVRHDGPAAEEGIVPGDVLIGMNGWETASAQDIDYVVTRPNLDQLGPLKFYVMRGKNVLFGHLDVTATASVKRATTQR